MNEKGKGIIAYAFGLIGGLIILLGMKDNTRNTRIHAAQAITMSVGAFAISMVAGFIPFIGGLIATAVSLLNLVLWIMGIIKVCNEEDPKLPIIGDFTMKIFAKQIGEEVTEVANETVETAQEPISENEENN